MKRFISIIVFVLILIVLFMILGQQEKNIEVKEVCCETKCWNVEVAQNKAKGLMNREKLAEDAGMLFVYKEEKIVSIWMKNMKISIDIIWLNKDKEVVHLVENAEPCIDECKGFKPDKKALYVLELNTGQIEENDVQLEQKLNFDDL